MDQGHVSGSPTGLRRLSPPKSRLQAGSFGRPRAPGVRKLTDKGPDPVPDAVEAGAIRGMSVEKFFSALQRKDRITIAAC